MYGTLYLQKGVCTIRKSGFWNSGVASYCTSCWMHHCKTRRGQIELSVWCGYTSRPTCFVRSDSINSTRRDVHDTIQPIYIYTPN